MTSWTPKHWPRTQPLSTMELGEAGWAFHLRASEFKAWLYSQLQLLGSAQSGSKQVLAQVSELRLPL